MSRKFKSLLVEMCLVIAVILVGSLPVAAHDIPASDHPATAQVELIEQLLASQRADTLGGPKLFSYVASNLVWGTRTLNVCFWNGDKALRSKIARLADSVAALTKARFAWGGPDFVTCPPDIYAAYEVRVSLVKDASLLEPGDHADDYFTSIGTTLLSDARRARVNLPFPPGASDGLYAEKTLHEFCHVLGCLHEHQQGLCDNDFNKPLIMSDFRYDEAQYEANFTAIPTSDALYRAVAFNGFDNKSIMLYSIDIRYFSKKQSPCYREKPVTQLSDDDRTGLKRVYNLQADPRLQTAADFQRLTAEFDAKTREYRAQALAYRTTMIQWTKETPLLSSDKRLEASNVFARFAAGADAKAADAKKEADSFRLTPETQALLAKVMALMPKKD